MREILNGLVDTEAITRRAFADLVFFMPLTSLPFVVNFTTNGVYAQLVTLEGIHRESGPMALLEFSEVSRILGGRKVLHRDIQGNFDLMKLGSRGVSKRALTNLANYLGLSTGQMAHLLPVSERTIQRHNASAPFSRAVSEHLLHIAEVAAKGSEVFEDRDHLLSWLNQPSIALANEIPLHLLKSRFGADMVLEELGRMEHGIFS